MKRLFCHLLLSVMTLAAYAQDYPVLKALSEKDRQERLAPASANGKWGFVNRKGKFRIKPCFDMAEKFHPASCNGADTVYAAKVMYGGRWGVISSNGLYLRMPEFDSLSDFDRGTAIFSRRGVMGLLSSRGSVIMDGMEDIRPFGECGTAWFRKDGKWGLCNLAGKVVMYGKYERLPEMVTGKLAGIRTGDLFGLLSMKDGRMVLPAVYDRLYGLENGYVKLMKNGLYGLADENGKVVLAPKMNSDQTDGGHAFMQFFDNDVSGRPALMAFCNGKILTMSQLDEMMLSSLGRDRYLDRDDPSCGRFPYWLRRGALKEMGKEAFAEQWKSDCTYHLPERNSAEVGNRTEIPQVSGVYVTVDRDGKVTESNGMSLVAGEGLDGASVEVDGTVIPCGSWLAPLLSSPDASRLAAYDGRTGSSVGEWTGMSARFRNIGLSVWGDYASVVDVEVEGNLMKRAYVTFSANGAGRVLVTADGVLYDGNGYVHPDESKFFIAGDMLVVPVVAGQESRLATRLYTRAGKLLTELGDLYCEVILGSGHDLRMLGRDAYFFCRSEVNMAARKYTKDDIGIDAEKFRVEYDGSYIYFYDKESGLLKSMMEKAEGSVPIPALRCTGAVWDGCNVAAVSVNHWDYAEETKWVFVPRITSGYVVENVNGYMFTVYPAGQDGIAVYSINPDIWTNEGLRYGYIGYDDGFFTQPLFEEARDFMGGTADVKTGGEWIKVDRRRCAELGKSMTAPLSLFLSEEHLHRAAEEVELRPELVL